MKNALLILIATILFGCSKKEIDVIDSNINRNVKIYTLLAYNDSTVYDLCDSSLIQVYDKEDKLIQSAYTKDGFIQVVPIVDDEDYRFTCVTRTYTDGFKIYHFECDWNLQRGTIYVCVGGGIGHYDGYGTTKIPIKDNFKRVAPFDIDENN